MHRTLGRACDVVAGGLAGSKYPSVAGEAVGVLAVVAEAAKVVLEVDLRAM